MTNAEKSSWMGDTFHLLGELGTDKILTGNGFYLWNFCRKYFAGFQICRIFARFALEKQG